MEDTICACGCSCRLFRWQVVIDWVVFLARWLGGMSVHSDTMDVSVVINGSSNLMLSCKPIECEACAVNDGMTCFCSWNTVFFGTEYQKRCVKLPFPFCGDSFTVYFLEDALLERMVALLLRLAKEGWWSCRISNKMIMREVWDEPIGKVNF